MTELPCPACGKSQARFADAGELYVHLMGLHNPNSVASHFANYVAEHKDQEPKTESGELKELKDKMFYIERALVSLIEALKEK